MKIKFYLSSMILVFSLMCFNASAQKTILFLSNSNPPEAGDSLLMDSVKIWGYNVVPVNSDEFAVADIASYDGLIICESIGSSGANPFQAAGYPVPCVTMEPYSVRDNRWGWIDQSDANLWVRQAEGTDALTTIINDNTHYITKEYAVSESVAWSTATEYSTSPSFIAFDISGAVSGALPLAKSKASELTTAAGLHTLWAIPEGSTVTDISTNTVTLKRMVFYNTHAVAMAVEDQTAGLHNIIKRSLAWVLGEDEQVAVNHIQSGFSGVKLLTNPVRGNGTISFYLNEPGPVSLSVVNLIGQQTFLRSNESFSAGLNEISFSTSGLNTGIYLYQLKVNNSIFSGKMHVLK